MKGFGQKSVSTRNLAKLHTLLSPKVNMLWIIEKWVAGVLSPRCSSCHRENREGENVFCEGEFLKREGESGQIVSRRKS